MRKSLVVQSVIFPKSDFNKRTSGSWLLKNGYRNRKVDEKPNTLRFRQLNPDKLKRNSYVSLKLPNGIVLVKGIKR